MDSQRFDELTRSLASGSSRRTLLRGMLGGVAALVGLRAGSTAAAPEEKVTICHLGDDGAYHLITINGNAYDAHVAHGDLVGCDEGFDFDAENCTCVPTNACVVLNDPCGDGGRCVTNVDTGNLVCALDPTGCYQCASAADCDPSEGDFCASDGNCGFDHCHPFHP